MTSSQMRIPKLRGEIVGAWVIAAFILFFVALSVDNLLKGVGIIGSSFWLLLVAGVIGLCCKEEGWRGVLVNLLGLFASRHFVEARATEAGPAEIRFGYKFVGFQRYYLVLAVSRIESLEWSTGQATHLAGRDMKDWFVSLWYDLADPTKRKEWSPKPDQEIYVVGPSRRREKTEVFALALVDFLRSHGANLVRTGECSFARG